ncbi:MAG: insulinase family protein [Clostridiales bacterium]|nr:insulinase family protein [Clostridiales bacterium]
MNHTCLKYRLIEEKVIDELRGTGTVYEHIRTGARVFTLKNEDKNKVFMIGFRTTPENSTGVAHIMEHSVLCGSEKYPLKDPFVELAKGSLNTFLNAMTFPDKTIYPIASMNDKDFMNLMDVYLDSVFNPKVYEEPKIFSQEGWHYELTDLGGEKEELKINGVVYNEMKGAFSNPDSVLERYTMNELFCDTVYSNESGGLPSDIPKLSYEEFLDFHRTYYHPSNSYIYLYGDMDMEEKLEWIDSNYLDRYERISVNSEIKPQKPFEEPKNVRRLYAIGENESEKGKCYLSENYVIEDEPTQVNAIAWQILESVLLTSPGAVLREALVKAGIGEDIYGGVCSEILQPYFSIVAKNTDEDRQEEFERIIDSTLNELVRNGINKKSLRAELNYIEFRFREEDYGSLPAGLAIGIGMFGSWLYDESPFTYLFYNEAVEEVRKLIDTDFFEKKIERFLIGNSFRARVRIVPDKGMTERENRENAEKLKLLKDSMSFEEKKRIAEQTEELKAYQAEPDSPETLAMLPVLQISDIDRKAEHIGTVRNGSRIFTEADTRGISYIKVLFPVEGLNEDELQFAALLTDIIGELNTVKRSYSDLYDEVMLNTGGISFAIEPYTERGEGKLEFKLSGMLSAELHTLDSKVEEGFRLTSEMINCTVFDDPERLTELLLEIRSRQQSKLESGSHTAAALRASSYISKAARFNDLTSGIAYYDFVNAACRLTKEPVHMKRFISSLRSVHDRIFRQGQAVYALYGSREVNERLGSSIEAFENDLRECSASPQEQRDTQGRQLMPLSTLNEGFRTSSQVNYVARCGSFTEAGLDSTGVLKVLRVMLNYDYLWIRLRVLGGAYGCMSGFARTGRCFLVSYRDPEVAKTNDVFEELPEYLENWQGDESTVAKYIIGAVSASDRPLTASDRANQAISDCFFGTTDEELQLERDQMLSCTAEDIRNTAPYIRALLRSEAICAIGNAGQIDECSNMFKSVRDLF